MRLSVSWCLLLKPRRVFRASGTAWSVAHTPALNTVPSLRAFDLIVLICQRAADKISGGRSPNDQAFESLQQFIGKPQASGLSGRTATGIQTASPARFQPGARGAFVAQRISYTSGQQNSSEFGCGAAIKSPRDACQSICLCAQPGDTTLRPG
jgi:hypothetical protein